MSSVCGVGGTPELNLGIDVSPPYLFVEEKDYDGNMLKLFCKIKAEVSQEDWSRADQGGAGWTCLCWIIFHTL